MIRRCNARLRHGTRCRKPALKGGLRCRLHGGDGGRPPGVPLQRDHNTALQAGRARWVERMRLAKQQGLIAKFPTGRKPGVRGRARSADRYIARGQRAVEAMMRARTRMPVPLAQEPAPAPVAEQAPVPWASKPKGERLSDVVDLGLQQVQRVLNKELDLSDDSPAALKRLSVVTNAALTVLSLQLRLDEAALRTSSQNNFDYAGFYERFGVADEGDEGA